MLFHLLIFFWGFKFYLKDVLLIRFFPRVTIKANRYILEMNNNLKNSIFLPFFQLLGVL